MYLMRSLSSAALIALAGSAFAQDAGNDPSATAELDMYMPIVRPWIPIIPYLDQGDAADLSTLDADQDVIDDAQRMIDIANALKGMLDEQNLDVEDPEVAQDLRLAIAVTAAFDMLREGSADADAADAADASAASEAEADLLDDVAKAVIIGGAIFGSDIRLKEEIVRVGTSPSGISIYEFSYRGTPNRWRGVIAQELVASHPDALVTGPRDVYFVDYNKIDVAFEEVAF